MLWHALNTKAPAEMQSRLPTSTEDWKMPGVDREEKVMVLELYCSLGSLAMKLLMMAVLAVPGPPTSSVACSPKGCVSASQAG